MDTIVENILKCITIKELTKEETQQDDMLHSGK